MMLLQNMLLIIAVHFCCQEGQLLHFLKAGMQKAEQQLDAWIWFAGWLLDRNPERLQEAAATAFYYLQKPLYNCLPCMASVWGAAYRWHSGYAVFSAATAEYCLQLCGLLVLANIAMDAVRQLAVPKF